MAEVPNDVAGSIRISRFTSDTGLLSKAFAVDANGKVEKHTDASLSSGTVETVSLGNFNDFGEVLTTLGHNQALAYGVSARGDGPVMSERRWKRHGQPEGHLLRNRDHFDWPASGGILMLDYDPPKDGEAVGKDALLDLLYAVVPALKEAAHYWWPSTSSCIRNTQTGEEITAIRGQRVYVYVADAQDIPRAGSALSERLWLAGYGRYEISKDGRLLARTPVDGSVWQPERLDFAAGAKCEPPLTQDRGTPLRLGGDLPLDTRRIADLSKTDNEKIERAKAAAKSLVKDKAVRQFQHSRPP